MRRTALHVNQKTRTLSLTAPALALLLLGAACSSGGESKKPAAATPSPSPSRIALPSADPSLAKRAKAGLIVRKDLGGKWGEYEEGRGVLRDVRPTGRIGCAISPDGGFDVTTVQAVVDGAIYQRGKATRFTTSTALAFKDVAAAKAAVAVFRSDVWRSCWTDEKTATAKAQPGGDEHGWRSEPVVGPQPGDKISQGLVQFQFQAIVDGKMVDANGVEQTSFFRIKNVVLVVALERAFKDSEPKSLDETTDQEVFEATRTALTRLRDAP